MAKLPALQFYPGDWRKDVGVQSLTYHDRGIWFEMLMLMHESEPRGRLVLNGKPMQRSALARILGVDQSTLDSALKAILDAGVAGEDEGVIINRRMVRDEENRQIQKEAGKLGGNPKLCENYNKPGFLYAVQRASDGKVKIGISDNPTKRLYKLRYLSGGDTLEMLAVLHVQDMGFAEKEQHDKYAHCASGEWFQLSSSELSTLLSTLKGKPKANQTPSSSPSTTEPDGGEEVPDLVKEIVCAHPKSQLRLLKPNEVRPGQETAVLQAMTHEIDRSSCTAEQALRMMLERTRMLAEKVPKTQWRFFKDVTEFYLAHEYRMEPEEFRRGDGNGRAGRTGKGEQHIAPANERVSAGVAAARAAAQRSADRASGRVDGEHDGRLSAPGAGDGRGSVPNGFRGPGEDVWAPGVAERAQAIPNAPEVLSPSERSKRGA